MVSASRPPSDDPMKYNLSGGALGSVGAIWPSTLQNDGLAGVMRAAGVGPRSATASGEGACKVAESIFTASGASPLRPPQVAAGSPVIVAADAEETAASKIPPSDTPAIA